MCVISVHVHHCQLVCKLPTVYLFTEVQNTKLYLCIAVENDILYLKHTYAGTSRHKVGHFFIQVDFANLVNKSFLQSFYCSKWGIGEDVKFTVLHNFTS